MLERWHRGRDTPRAAANSTAAAAIRMMTGRLFRAMRKSPEKGATNHNPRISLLPGQYQKAQSGT
jgi:hypothetical protein